MSSLYNISSIERLPFELSQREGDSVFDDGDKKLIELMYMSECGKSIRNCNCRNKYSDALFEIKLKLKEMENKYQLKAGIIIWINNECYSNANLTDKIAKKYLKAHPESREKKFARWAEDKKPVDMETEDAEADSVDMETEEKAE